MIKQESKIATIEDAIQIAAQAHKGQTDKAGAVYILHPLRLMMRMKTESEMMTAIFTRRAIGFLLARLINCS